MTLTNFCIFRCSLIFTSIYVFICVADPSSSSVPENSNFLKGIKWSPDGVCFLTAADDNCLRVYDLPPVATSQDPPHSPSDGGEDPFWPAVRIPAGELIYDYSWYPWATATDPATCCFAVATRAHPIHLYDAVTGQIRCSYRPYNALDELASSYSTAFTPDGTKLLAGCRAAIEIFDVERPGRDHATITTFQKKKEGQPGIISCIACAQDASGLMAAGAYSGIAALYDYRTHEQLAVLEGHTGGITHLKFSACGTYLYSGARRDGAIYCWDARNVSGALYILQRGVENTNQRIYFDIEPCGRHLASGGEDGCVRYWDLRDGSEAGKFRAAGDTVNGCEFHPGLPVLAIASGQRRFGVAEEIEAATSSSSSGSESENEEEEGLQGEKRWGRGRKKRKFELNNDENVLRLWRLGQREVPLGTADGGDVLIQDAVDNNDQRIENIPV